LTFQNYVFNKITQLVTSVVPVPPPLANSLDLGAGDAERRGVGVWDV